MAESVTKLQWQQHRYRAALTPTSPTQLNTPSVGPDPSRKRKRLEQHGSSLDDSIFSGEALSRTQKPATTTFATVTTLPRTGLPLSWLSPIRGDIQPPPGHVFKTEASLLRDEQHTILIARLLPNGGLYAIEHATEKVYTAWPLSNWVSEELCYNASRGNVTKPELQQLISHHRGHSRAGSVNSGTAVLIPTPSSPKKAKNRRGAIARISILTPNVAAESSQPINTSECSHGPVQSPQNLDTLNPDGGNLPMVHTPHEPILVSDNTTIAQAQTPLAQAHIASPCELPEAITTMLPARQSHLDAEQLVQQYLETLYLSKASLAFYAKGPLSRARAQARNPDVGIDSETLKECYLSMILPTKKVDVKYKESISNVIGSLPENHQETDGMKKTTKRKQAKKVKLGKHSLYSGEDEIVAKWWNSKELKPSMTTSITEHDDEQRKAISELRNRETEMQSLLILEVLHLENVISKPVEPGEPLDNKIKVETIEDGLNPLAEKPARARKQRDLNAELDAIAERLCIWHTVALEDMLSSPEKARESSNESNAKSKDKLQDFCRDVILPFYSAKLPVQAKSICRKLGGPEISPQRARSNPSKATNRPASAVGSKTKPRPATKRSLQRVLSEDQSVRQGSPPVLSRSLTAPLVSKIKSEPSGTDARPMSRSGMQKSVSFSNREIDLVADAKAHDTKRRKLDKLAIQKKELEEAIDALKKPNRTNTAKAIMDEIEKRNIDLETATTKTGDKEIHITATPRRAKPRPNPPTRNIHSQGSSQIPERESLETHPVIPSSTIKPHQATLTIPSSSQKKRAVLSAIHDTPSRNTTKHMHPSSSDAVVEATPSTNRLRPDLSCPEPTYTPLPARLTASSSTTTTTTRGRPVLFTPLKRRDGNGPEALMFKDVPEIPERAGRAMDRVMGGMGKAGFGFESETEGVFGDGSAPKTRGWGGAAAVVGGAGGGEGARSIYAELGWDDD